MKLKYISAFLVFSVFISFIFTGCGYYSAFTAYYNTLYNAKKSFEEGVKLHLENKNKDEKSRTDKKYFEDAIQKCWRIIEFHGYKNKYSDDAILLIAKSEFYLDKYISSRNHIDAFFQKFPDSDLIPEAIFYRGRCDLALGDTTSAISQFNEALVKAKKNSLKSQIFLQLAEIAFQQKNYEQSSEFYKKAFKAARTDIEKSTIKFYLAESYFNVGDYKKAIKEYRSVLKKPPTIQMEYLAQLHLALAEAKLGKTEKAIEILEKMLTAKRYSKYYGEIYAEIANIYWESGDTEQALYYYKEGINSKTGEGSAKSAYLLASHFENDFGNVDSAMFYYNMVPKFSRNSIWGKKSIDKVEYLKKFQSLYKKVIDEERFIDRWENDPVFRDSILEVKRLDSLLGSQKRDIKLIPFKDLLKKLSENDTANYYYTPELLEFSQKEYPSEMELYNFRIDSISQAFSKDSLIYLDTLKFPRTDKLAHLFFDYQKQKRLITELRQKKKSEARSIEQIRNDYKKHLLEYADFLLLETTFVDSARVKYEKFIQSFDDSVHVPKALYSLYYIHSKYLGDSVTARKYKQMLLTQYPNTPFAESFTKVTEEKNSPAEKIEQVPDSIKLMYQKAEDFFFNQQYDSTYFYLKTIISKDTVSDWYPKTLFFLGYLFEKGYQIPDSAKTYYQLLVDKFPQTEYGKNAKIRLTPPKEIVIAQKAQPDSTQKAITEQKSEQTVFQYPEEIKKIIIERIERLLALDYMEEARKGEVKRYWSKKQLREFLNEIR